MTNLKKVYFIGTIFTMILLMSSSINVVSSPYVLSESSNKTAISESYPNSPFNVTMETAKTFSLNEDINVIITVKSNVIVSNTNVKIVLTSGILLVKGDLFWNGSLKPNDEKVFSIIVKIQNPGEYEIYTHVTDKENKQFGNNKALYLSFEQNNGKISNTPQINPSTFLMKAVMIDDKSINYSEQDGVPLSVTISGREYYLDEAGVYYIKIKYAKLELWRQGWPWDTLEQTTYTNNDGYFQFSPCNPGTFKITVFAETHDSSGHNAVRISDGGWPIDNVYAWETGWHSVSSSKYFDCTVTGSYRGLFETYRSILEAYDWLYNQVSWSRSKISVNYPRGDDPAYHVDWLGSEWIEIISPWEWDRYALQHEYGHAVMYKAYDNDFPPTSFSDDHWLSLETDGGFALTEGWSQFFGCAVDNNDIKSLESGYYADIQDTGDWDGNIVEGAVAGLLWDIFDGTSSSDYPSWSFSHYGDYISNRFDRTWTIIRNDHPGDMNGFWSNWNSRYGVNVDIWAVFYNQRMSQDLTAPTNPTSYTSSHIVGVSSTDNTIYVQWSGATDAVSGVYGYGVLWSSAPSLPPTTLTTTNNYITSSALTDGTWYINIRTVDRAQNWNSGYYSVGPFYIYTVPPGNPSNLDASNPTATSIQLSWTKGSGSDYTMIRKRTDQYPTSPTDGIQAYYGTGTSTTDTSLTSGQRYYYRAWAYASSSGLYSTGYSSDNEYTLPGNPSNLNAYNPTQTTIDLSWAKGTGGDKTRIQRKTGGYPTSPTDGTQIYFNTGTSTIDTGLTPGTTYYYRAWAYDTESGYYSSGYSQDYETTSPNQPPYTPSSPDPHNNSINVSILKDLSWIGGDPDIYDTVSYDVFFGTINPPPQVVSNQTTTTYNPGTMNYSSIYYWHIVSWDNHDAYAAGPIWTFTTMSIQTPIVTTLYATGVEEINATLCGVVNDASGPFCIVDFEYGFTTSYGFDTYDQEKTTGDFFSENLGSLASGTLYHFRARATNDNGTSYGSDMIFLTKPESPTDLTVQFNGSGFLLSWVHGNGYDRSVVRGQTGSFPSTPLSGFEMYNGTSSSCTHLGLSPGDIWYYRVWEYVEDSGLYQFSDSYVSGNKQYLNPPQVTTYDASLIEETDATLNAYLDNDGGETNTVDCQYGFTTNYDSDSTDQTLTSGQTYTLGAINNLLKGTLYQFRARAINSRITSYGSDKAFLTKPDPPSNMNASIYSTQINLTWVKGTGANNTIILRKFFSPPTSPIDGTIIYNGTGITCIDLQSPKNVPIFYGGFSYTIWSSLETFSDTCSYDCIWYNVTPSPPTDISLTALHPVTALDEVRIQQSWIPDPDGQSTCIVMRNDGQIPRNYHDGEVKYLPNAITSETINSYADHNVTYGFYAVAGEQQKTTKTLEDGTLVDWLGAGSYGWIGYNVARLDDTNKVHGTYSAYFNRSSLGGLSGLGWRYFENSNYPIDNVSIYVKITTALDGQGSSQYFAFWAYGHAGSWTTGDVRFFGDGDIETQFTLGSPPIRNFGFDWVPNRIYKIDYRYFWSDNSLNMTVSDTFGNFSFINTTLPGSEVGLDGIAVQFGYADIYVDDWNEWEFSRYSAGVNKSVWTQSHMLSNFYGPSYSIINNSRVNISWYSPGGYHEHNDSRQYDFGRIVIRKSTTDYPADPQSGTLVCNISRFDFPQGEIGQRTGYYIDTVTPDQRTYYCIWGYSEYYNNYSKYNRSFDLIAYNMPPYTPSNPFPPNDTINVPIGSNLTWTGGDPNSGDTTTYDIYFGTSNPPPKIVDNQTATIYDPGTMNYNTTYYWKIIAWDNYNATTSGPLWTFTTIGNHQPTVTTLNATGVEETNATLQGTFGDAPVLYENYATGDNSAVGIFKPSYVFSWGQTFTPIATHTIIAVELLLYRQGTVGMLTIGIRATDGTGNPTGSDLTSGITDGTTLTTSTSGEWRRILLSPYVLTAGTKYAIVLQPATWGDTNNQIRWRINSSNPGGYLGGNLFQWDGSYGIGKTWDGLFKEYGGGCFVYFQYGLTTSYGTNTTNQIKTIGQTFSENISTSKKEYQEINDTDSIIYGSEWYGQTFTVGTMSPNIDYYLTKASFILYKWGGTPGILTVRLQATDDSGKPTGPYLSSGYMDCSTITSDEDGLWYNITMTPYLLSASTNYALVLNTTTTTPDILGIKRYTASSIYPGGTEIYSTTSGSTWGISSGQDVTFRIYSTLVPGTLCHYRAVANNTFGTSYGSDSTFLTKPLAPSNLQIKRNSTGFTLTWDKGTGANNTVLRGEIGSYPTDINDGMLIYNDTGITVNHLGLTQGDTWYYRAWSYSEWAGHGQYSDSYPEAYEFVGVTNPIVLTNAATGVEEINATLWGYLSEDGGEACTVGFEWGTTVSYGNVGIVALTSSSGNWEVPDNVTKVDVLVVAGGGGAGGGYSSTVENGGGGGAGGLVWKQDYPVTPSEIISYSVGAAGTGGTHWTSRGNTGGDSTFGNLTAKGGGGGGSSASTVPYSGGSGGGAGRWGSECRSGGTSTQSSQTGWSGIYGYGNIGSTSCGSGYTAGGGGGAGGAGTRPTGGAGMNMSYPFGTYYGVDGWFATGGNGDSGGTYEDQPANTGNGGHACPADEGRAGYDGGSGIVLIRYKYELSSPKTFNHTLTGLALGTLYHYRALATNTNGTGYDDDMTFLTKPNPLTDFVATKYNDTRIDLSWSNNQGGDGAYIEYSIGSLPNPWNPCSGTKIDADGYIAGNTYQHIGLILGNHYYYKAWTYAEDQGILSDGSLTKPFGDDPQTADVILYALPTVITNDATGIGITNATLQGILNNNGFPPAVGSLQLYENFTSDDGGDCCQGTSWLAMTFTVGTNSPNVNLSLSNISLRCYWFYSTGNDFKVSIRNTDGTGNPTGSDLASVTLDSSLLPSSDGWYNFTLSPTITLYKSTKYAIVAGFTSSTDPTVVWNGYYPTSFTEGTHFQSSNRGGSWSEYSNFPLDFKVWAYAILDGCNVYFQYGTTTGYGTNTTNQNKTAGQAFIQGITELTQGTLYHYRAVANNTIGTGYGSDKTFLTKPYSLSEFNATTLSPTEVNLSWLNGAGGDGAYIEYTVGSAPDPWNAGNGIQINDDGYISGSIYQHTGLTSQTNYYYKAWAYAEDQGTLSDGTPTKPFDDNPMTADATTTTPNQPPYQPSDPNPIDGQNNVSITTGLTLTGGDPDIGDIVTYDVYFGTTNPPPKIINNQSTTTYNPGTLNYNTIYYWKIIAWDNHGASTIGPLWIFTTQQQTASWWNTNWQYRKQITIDHMKVTADLNNFPILISTTSQDFTTHAQTDGDDFAFIDHTNSIKFNHEIETYNSTSGTLITWVNITNLSSSVDTIMYIYYGNPTCTSQQNILGTWDSNYVGVWHMNQVSGNILDSSGTKNGIVIGSPEYQQSGKIGPCIYLDGVNTEYFDITDDIYKFNTEDLTTEVWVKYIENRNFYENTLYFGDQDAYPQLMTGKWRSGHATDGGKLYASNYHTGGPYEIVNTPQGGNTHIGHWLYQVGRYERGNELTLYINESKVDTDPCSSNDLGLSSNFISRIGRGTAIGYEPPSAHIYIDEVRVSKGIARSQAWLQTTYNTTNSPSTFCSIGPEELPNLPPIIPINPNPAHQAIGIPINTDLTWNGGDPDQGDTVTYDVHFGITNPPPQCSSNQSVTMYDPGTLNYNTTYYWKIIAWDNHNATTTGPTWIFTTEQNPNSAPNTPDIPTGQQLLDRDQPGTFTTKTSDPDNDHLSYQFDWGDGTFSNWTSLVESNQQVSKTHTWYQSGTYIIKARAQDEHGETSLWSQGITISVAETYSWSMFHHDIGHTGYSASSAPTTNTLLWSFSTGDKVRSSPSIVNGKVYVASYDGKVYCRDAVTGTMIWTVSVGDMPLFSSPTIADEFLYIGSYDDHIYCLNVTNGDQIWKFKTNDNVISAPAVVDGYVYVGSWDESLYCLKAGPSDGVDEGVSDPPGSTYDLIWKYTTNGDIRCSPAVADDLIYVGSYDGTLYCLYSANGSLKWKFQIVDDWVFSSPTVSDGKVFFGMFWDKKIYCFDAISGDQIWNQTIQKLIGSSPSVYNNRLYIGSHFGPTGNISCLDTTTGQVIWEFPTGYWVYSSPTIADDKIYIGSCDNKIYCLNAENGYQIWNYSTGDQIWSSPAIANGLLVIGSDDGNVYAFNDTRSSPKIPNNPSPAPQVSDDNIDTILSRTKGNPDFNDIAPYEVFFGTTKP